MGPAPLTFADAEAFLTAAEFEDCRPLWHSSNYVFLGQLTAADGKQGTAVYKPRRGESPLWDFPPGTLFRREAAAYRLSRLLGWDFIPPTVIRDGPQGIGSVQAFIRHDPNSHFFVQRDDPALVPQLQRMAVFDFIANNADRKGGHCLLDEDGRERPEWLPHLLGPDARVKDLPPAGWDPEDDWIENARTRLGALSARGKLVMVAAVELLP